MKKLTNPFIVTATSVFFSYMLIKSSALLPATNTHIQTQTWSQPIQLSETGWFPDIATDRTGQIHVVWSHSAYLESPDGIRNGYDVVFYSHRTNGKTWSPAFDIVALPQQNLGSVYVTRPAIFIDRYGTFHMSFRDTDVHYSRSPVVLASSATNWIPPYKITADEEGYFSHLAMDSKDKLHLVFTENAPDEDCVICYHVFYRVSNNYGFDWSIRTDVSRLPTGAAKPKILIDELDNLHVVWESGRGGTLGGVLLPTKIMYATSNDGGKTFAVPKELRVPGNGSALNITIGQDGDHNLIITWLNLENDRVYYQKSRDHGKTWSLPVPIPNVLGSWSLYPTRLDDYTMATDSAGNVHFVMVGRKTEDANALSLLHLVWDGFRWSPAETITTLQGDVPEWPRLAIGNGNKLHLVWFVREEAHIWSADPEHYQIWYAQRTTDAPEIESEVWPTKSPVITIESTEVPRPTTTPRPVVPSTTEVPISPGAAASLLTENDEIQAIGMGLLPVALLLVSLIVYMRRRGQ